MTDPPRSRRQRGFSLIVVFVIIIVMVGVASAVMITTQGDLQVAGSDREQMTALYAAEAGVSWAQWVLIRYPQPSAGPWTPLLANANPANVAYSAIVASYFCGPRVSLPTTTYDKVVTTPNTGVAAVGYNPLPGNLPPAAGAPVVYDATRGTQFYWCIHNNVLDPEYRKTGANCGANVCPDGDIVDGDGLITIESYGYYYGPGAAAGTLPLATAHITVDVSYFNPMTSTGKDYGMGPGNALGNNSTGGTELSPNFAGSATTTF